MKARKNAICFATALILAVLGLAMSVCSGQAENTPKTILLAIVTVPGSAQDVTASKFKELIEERSGNRFMVEISRAGALGSETEILEKIRLNVVQMAVITTEPMEAFVPEAGLVGFPFLFKSNEQADRILDGPLGREILDSLARAGFKGLHFSENGFRHLTNDVRPVTGLADVSGLRIRVMESSLHRDLWTLLGAKPLPLPWPIDEALEAGLVDGQENPLWVPWVYRFDRFQRYLSLTGHVYSSHVDLAGLSWFDSLPEADQNLVVWCMRDAAVFQRAHNRNNEAAYLAGLKARGMQVVEDPDIGSFRAKASELTELPGYRSARIRNLLDRLLAATQEDPVP
ncbi:MAG: TRAP transporter substrate-binding protein [Deltaproteobacteria bacterium]|nr:TRAP transporter substrate-binding protein [Deltaproteobacteria bacterium]